MGNPSAKSAPFMLLFRNAGPETHAHLSPAEKDALTKKWNDWFERLAAQGKAQHGHPLALERRVVSGARGERVTDGPFAETKEVIGGYFFLTVADLDEATKIAKECPGLPLGVSVEVRAIAATSPVLDGVRGRVRNSREHLFGTIPGSELSAEKIAERTNSTASW